MFHKIRWTVGGEGLHKYQIRYKREHGVPYHTCSVGWCRRLFVLYRRTGGGILFSFISDDPSAYVRKLLLLLSMCYERGSGFGNKSQVLIPALPLGKSEWVALLYEFLPHLSPQVITWAKGIHELSLWDVTQVIESLFFFLTKPGYSIISPIKQGVTFELLCCIRAAAGLHRPRLMWIDPSIQDLLGNWQISGFFLFICLTS